MSGTGDSRSGRFPYSASTATSLGRCQSTSSTPLLPTASAFRASFVAACPALSSARLEHLPLSLLSHEPLSGLPHPHRRDALASREPPALVRQSPQVHPRKRVLERPRDLLEVHEREVLGRGQLSGALREAQDGHRDSGRDRLREWTQEPLAVV